MEGQAPGQEVVLVHSIYPPHWINLAWNWFGKAEILLVRREIAEARRHGDAG